MLCQEAGAADSDSLGRGLGEFGFATPWITARLWELKSESSTSPSFFFRVKMLGFACPLVHTWLILV